MIDVTIPGRGRISLRYLLLDMNGTIAVEGKLLPGVAEAIERLKTHLDVRIVTGDTWGTADEIERQLGVKAVRLPDAIGQAEGKANYVASLGAGQVVAIGNGANDVLMLKHAALSIAVMGPEGAAAALVMVADVIVGDILAALDLLIDPRRISATLRT
jgi:P-type E1-E2 ATPase